MRKTFVIGFLVLACLLPSGFPQVLAFRGHDPEVGSGILDGEWDFGSLIWPENSRRARNFRPENVNTTLVPTQKPTIPVGGLTGTIHVPETYQKAALQVAHFSKLRAWLLTFHDLMILEQ